MTNRYISDHYYLQWGGSLPGGETWSCGLRMSPINTGAVSQADQSAKLASVVSAVQTFHSRASGGVQVNSRALLSFVKFNAIDAITGHYKYPVTNVSYPANIAGGYVDAGVHPNQIALCVTLLTAVQRGPASKGRFYVPLPAYTIGTDGLIGATYATNAKTGVMDFVTALNAIDASNFKVAVYGTKQGVLAQNLVTAVKVGRVLDTIRRRRRQLPETYAV